MPEINIPTSPEDLSLSSGLEVISIMIFPNEKGMRKNYLANMTASFKDTLLKVGEKFPFPKTIQKVVPPKKRKEITNFFVTLVSEDLEQFFLQQGGISTLCNSPEYEKIQKNFIKNSWKGRIAGQILILIWRMKNSCVPTGASINKAKFLVYELYRKQRNLHAKDFPFNEKFISEAWSNFKTVSHLWAAFFAWETMDKPQKDTPFPVTQIFEFISLAENFRNFGTTYLPRGQKTPILLNKQTWFPPRGFKPFDFQFEILPLYPDELEVLREYRAPKKI
jgi:hypothetical protein